MFLPTEIVKMLPYKLIDTVICSFSSLSTKRVILEHNRPTHKHDNTTLAYDGLALKGQVKVQAVTAMGCTIVLKGLDIF